MDTQFHATTIVAVRKNGKTAIAGDGQVTFGEHTIMKANARKVRTLYHDKILAGFAGSVADAFTLFEKFEGKLEAYNGNLQRAAVELAKEWRTDRVLRKLEALLLVADKQQLLMLSGNGEVIEPDGDVAAIGSGGFYALAAVSITLLGYKVPTEVLFILVGLAGASTIGTQILIYAYVGQYYPMAIRSTGIGFASGVGRSGAILAPIVIGTLVGMALPLEQNFIAIAIPAVIALIAVGLVNQSRSASAL